MAGFTVETTKALPCNGDTYAEILGFLYEEAAVLDERRHEEWLTMLSEDIIYQMPVRSTSAHSLDDSLRDGMAHFDEDRYSLEKRVERFLTEHAWAEDPPSRTRRFVTNTRAWETETADEWLVSTSLLLFRSRGDIRDHDLVSAGRRDILRRVDGRIKLARRLIAVDESVLHMQNLAVFL
jgi:phthalate 3,4-dioxygenase beta subunit